MEVRGVVSQIDGGCRAVIFTKTAYCGRVAEAPQIVIICAPIYPLRNALPRLFSTEPKQHRFEKEFSAVFQHGLRERRWLDKQEPMKEGSGEFLGDCQIALVSGHNVQDDELSQTIGMVERHSVSDSASAVVANNRKSRESQVLHYLHLIQRHGSFRIGEVVPAPRRFAAIAVAAKVCNH